jgi:hypothetical protein
MRAGRKKFHARGQLESASQCEWRTVTSRTNISLRAASTSALERLAARTPGLAAVANGTRYELQPSGIAHRTIGSE